MCAIDSVTNFIHILSAATKWIKEMHKIQTHKPGQNQPTDIRLILKGEMHAGQS